MKALILFQFLALLVNGENVQRKPNNLTLLVLHPFTTNPPRFGRFCAVSMQILADIVNSRSDILPDYHIKLELKDEGGGGDLGPTNFMNFMRQNEAKPQEIAPIILGPFFGPGCLRFSPILTRYNIIHIPNSCSDPSMSGNRNRYPNIFRPLIPSEMMSISRIKFMQEVGGWKHFAVITVSQGFDFGLAKDFARRAMDAGLTRLYFEVTDELDSEFHIARAQALRETNARVIALVTGAFSHASRFLCRLHQYGFRGNKYVFLLMTPTMTQVTANLLPPGCSLQMAIEQLKLSFWIGYSQEAPMNFGPTLPGSDFDLLAFEKEFDRRTNRSRLPDYETRHRYFDQALQAALTMHETEKALKLRNLTLKDWASNPAAIADVLKKTAASLTYNSIRAGEAKYSKRIEMDFEPQWIFRYTGDGFKAIGKVEFTGKGDPEMPQNHHLSLLEPINWPTEDGKAPKDLPNFFENVDAIPRGFFGFILAAAFLASIGQAAAMIVNKKNKMKRSKLVLILACLFLNASSCLFAISEQPMAYEACIAQRVTLTLGIGLLSGFMFSISRHYRNICLIYFAQKSSKKHRSRTALAITTLFHRKDRVKAPKQKLAPQTSNQSNALTIPPELDQNSKQLDEEKLNEERYILPKIVVVGLVTVVILTVALSYDVFEVEKVSINLNGAVYELENDAWVDTYSYNCHSKKQIEVFWVAALVVFDAMLLFLGTFYAYETQMGLRSSSLNHHQQHHHQGDQAHQHQIQHQQNSGSNFLLFDSFRDRSRLSMLAVGNATTLFLAGIIMVVILSSTTTTMKNLSVMLAVLSLTLSATSSLIMFWDSSVRPLIKKIANRQG